MMTAMPTAASTSIGLRPYLSPMWPHNGAVSPVPKKVAPNASSDHCTIEALLLDAALFDKDRQERKQHRQTHRRRSEDAHCEVLFPVPGIPLRVGVLDLELFRFRQAILPAITVAPSPADDVRSSSVQQPLSQKLP